MRFFWHYWEEKKEKALSKHPFFQYFNPFLSHFTTVLHLFFVAFSLIFDPLPHLNWWCNLWKTQIGEKGKGVIKTSFGAWRVNNMRSPRTSSIKPHKTNNPDRPERGCTMEPNYLWIRISIILFLCNIFIVFK